MPTLMTTLSVSLSTVDGITGLTDVIKAAKIAGCFGNYDGDPVKVVTRDSDRDYCAVILPSPGLLRFLADKIDRLS